MQGSPGTVAAHAHRNGYQHSGGVNLIVKTIIKCGWCQLLLLLFIIVFLLIVFCSSEPYMLPPWLRHVSETGICLLGKHSYQLFPANYVHIESCLCFGTEGLCVHAVLIRSQNRM